MQEDLERLEHLLLKLQSLVRDDQGRHMDRVKVCDMCNVALPLLAFCFGFQQTKDLIFLVLGKFSVLTGRSTSAQVFETGC